LNFHFSSLFHFTENGQYFQTRAAILLLDSPFYSSYGVAWKGEQLLGKKFLNHGFPSIIFGHSF
jgi:hypothetical protein